jgi:hypothetical protein
MGANSLDFKYDAIRRKQQAVYDKRAKSQGRVLVEESGAGVG